MTLLSYLGVLAGLALVLGLIALLIRPLGALSLRARSGGGTVELEVLARVALTPKQGMAAVRFGRGTALVSYGEGGVRLLLEGGEAEQSPVEEVGDAPVPASGTFAEALRSSDGLGFGRGGSREPPIWNRIRTAVRGVGLALLLGFSAQLGGIHAAAAAQDIPAQEIPAPVIPAPEDSTALQGQAPAQQAPASLPDGVTALSALTRSFKNVDVQMGEGEDALHLSGPVGTVVLMGILTLLPTLVLLMTGFTRILVVLHLLRQALGTQAAPPSHLLAAMALLLTGFVMAPTLSEVNRTALAPWLAGEMGEAEMMQAAVVPFRGFMLNVTREQDLETFLEIQGGPMPTTVDEVPLVVVTSAFITSELRNAFQMGFALFLPFVVIDVVVASVLMSMGMFMLPPVMVSLPFKLLLFVLVDGWGLVVGGIVRSFHGA